jgi:hypothetical protein
VCGVYALKDFDRLFMDHWFPIEGWLCCFGQVALWGRVVEHEHGYRGQFAYPVRLWLPEWLFDACGSRLSEAYGIPVLPWSGVS